MTYGQFDLEQIHPRTNGCSEIPARPLPWRFDFGVDILEQLRRMDRPELAEGVRYLPNPGPHRCTVGPPRRDPAFFAVTRRCPTCERLILMFPMEMLEDLPAQHPWRVFEERLSA